MCVFVFNECITASNTYIQIRSVLLWKCLVNVVELCFSLNNVFLKVSRLIFFYWCCHIAAHISRNIFRWWWVCACVRVLRMSPDRDLHAKIQNHFGNFKCYYFLSLKSNLLLKVTLDTRFVVISQSNVKRGKTNQIKMKNMLRSTEQ